MEIGKTLRQSCGIMILSLALVALSVFLPGVGEKLYSHAAQFTDVEEHWAAEYIEKAVDYEFVNGYSDGTFRPDDPITRAEFTKMVNSVLKNDLTADIDFEDVSEDDWFCEDVRKGVAACFISGYSTSSFGPGNKITRQEAAVMLSRVVPASGEEVTIKVFGDYEDVASWAETAFRKMVGKGYIGGSTTGNLNPVSNLTRAQAAKLLVDIYENENIVSKNQTVVQSDVTLKDTIYTNQISIGEKVEDGDVTIRNCTILGTLNIEGGGTDDSDGGVRISDSRVANANIHRNDEAVQVFAEGETTVVNSRVTDEACLEERELEKNDDFGQGFRNVSVGRAAYTSLIGDFESVVIGAAKVDLMLEEGTVDQLTAEIVATKTNVAVSINAVINNADIRAEGLVFEGEGTVKHLNARANGITYETEPESITTASNVKEPPKQAFVNRITPLLSSLSVRYLGGDTGAAYTNLPISSSEFYYYIPSNSTDLTLNFRIVTDETQDGYVPEPEYSVKYEGVSQNVQEENGLMSCDVAVASGTEPEKITVTVSSGNREYGKKTYTINLRRIDPSISSVYAGSRNITDYLYSSRSDSESDPYEMPGSTADLTVNLSELDDADFVSYSIYKMNESGAEIVAEGISGGNAVTLERGAVYRIVTQIRCYSDSYAGCKTVQGITRYVTLK